MIAVVMSDYMSLRIHIQINSAIEVRLVLREIFNNSKLCRYGFHITTVSDNYYAVSYGRNMNLIYITQGSV